MSPFNIRRLSRAGWRSPPYGHLRVLRRRDPSPRRFSRRFQPGRQLQSHCRAEPHSLEPRMAHKRVLPRGSFKAKSDDGKEVEIFIFQTMTDESVNYGDDTTASALSLQTRDGKEVNRIDKGVYQIVETGLVVRSSAPVAP